MVGLRLGGLALWLTTAGLPSHYLPDLISVLDSWFPGEFGELNHSKHFVTTFKASCVRAMRKFKYWDLHARMPALQIPSDVAIVSDGISAQDGTPLHATLIVQEGRSNRLQVHLLGLHPVAGIAKDASAKGVSSGLRFSSAAGLVHHTAKVLREFGMSDDIAAARFATRVGDGLEEGPASLQVGRAQAQALGLQASNTFGSLDAWHSAETAGSHADESVSSNGLLQLYLDSARAMRNRFGFGAASAIPGAVGRRYGIPSFSRLAPVGESTRTLRAESVVRARNHLRNVRSNVYSLMVALKAVIFKAREDSVRKGHCPGPSCGAPLLNLL